MQLIIDMILQRLVSCSIRMRPGCTKHLFDNAKVGFHCLMHSQACRDVNLELQVPFASSDLYNISELAILHYSSSMHTMIFSLKEHDTFLTPQYVKLNMNAEETSPK